MILILAQVSSDLLPDGLLCYTVILVPNLPVTAYTDVCDVSNACGFIRIMIELIAADEWFGLNFEVKKVC